MFAAPIVAQLVTKTDPRRLVTFGVLWMAMVMIWRSTFVQGLAFHQLVWPQLAQGLAMPFFFIPLMSLAMADLSPTELAGGAGLLNFVRTTAGAFAFATSPDHHRLEQFDDHRAHRLRRPLEQRRRGYQPDAGLGMSHGQALGFLDNLVQSQSVMLSTNHIFMAIGLLMALSVLAIWLAPKPAGPIQGGAGGH